MRAPVASTADQLSEGNLQVPVPGYPEIVTEKPGELIPGKADRYVVVGYVVSSSRASTRDNYIGAQCACGTGQRSRSMAVGDRQLIVASGYLTTVMVELRVDTEEVSCGAQHLVNANKPLHPHDRGVTPSGSLVHGSEVKAVPPVDAESIHPIGW